jgi:hypothetical protein
VCAVLVLLLTGFTASGQSPATEGFGVALGADKATYKSGEAIRITLEVFNTAAEPVRLDFSTGQRYDFVLQDAQQKEVWRWSAGQMFTMALGSETLGPGRPRLQYREECALKLAPGVYTVTGLLADVERRVSATTKITVQ